MENLQQDYDKAGEYMHAALHEVAVSLLGEELAAQVADKAHMSDSAWPNPEILKVIDEFYPGFAEQVMSRAEAIQQETHARELAQFDGMMSV